MPIQYSLDAKNARLEAVLMTLGVGAKLVLRDSGGKVIVEFALPFPAGIVKDGVLTFGGPDGVLESSAIADGVVTSASYVDAKNSVVIGGLTVGRSDADIIVDNTNIAIKQTIRTRSPAIIVHS